MTDLADRVKAETSLRALVEGDGVAWDRRKTREAAGDWWGCCPLHGEATPSFHVVEPSGAGGWFKCFGCGAKGTAIDYVMARDGCDAGAAIKRLAEAAGLEREQDPERARKRRAERDRKRAAAEADAARSAEGRLRLAGRIWKERCDPSAVALLVDYLTARGVDLAALEARFGAATGWRRGVPPTLRLCPRADFYHERAREPAFTGPAMVGFVTEPAPLGEGPRAFAGVHRTWITKRGRMTFPNAPGAKVPKKWLGGGRMFGGSVRLAPPARTVVVGEGIETTLAAFAAELAAGREDVTAEAALSLGALVGSGDGLPETRGGWRPGPEVEEVLVFAEGRAPDPVKDARARAEDRATRHERAAQEIARIGDRLRALGVHVEIFAPPGGAGDGRDFADSARGAA